ncbi:MAG: 1-pyrroline-5-carboxylate dehydrogenase [Candidatus Zixiibacteriota bacterium]|nr:MAG: 1-pyrroline-5-carboxylate dehydrogenase [candidate division Zixibacteria bacterium]HDL03075.1 L-glutamate gamma-semialdehyde dehydrogenase [candidate division Zixibacteria bacterium]
MGNFKVPIPKNEPVYDYIPGSADRAGIDKAIAELKSQKIDVPMIIGGQEIRVGNAIKITSPHDHSLELGQWYQGGKEQIELAIDTAMKAKKDWEFMPWEQKAAIFLKAADLLTGPWRYKINAATMLAHSKSIFQAEIDAVCELADFFRYNAYYAEQIFNMQPDNAKGIWDRLDYRPLEGFVFAVTPFNFVSIAGNLPTSPAIMGNTVLWKPASSVTYTAYMIMQILKEAGLPDGVINMVTARGVDVGEYVLKNPNLAGIHFTGSTAVFQTMWKTVGGNIANYRSYPRIVGETGGKDFIFVHNSANVEEVATAIIRGAFEFQGQKCSAASRSYIPKSMWPALKEKILADMKDVRMGGVEDVNNFVNAIIDKSAYNDIVAYIDYAKEADDAEFICGGNYDDSKGWFIEPTIIVTTNPKFKLIEEEIFGPVITLYIYDDNDFEKTLELCDSTSPYALTGAIFARDRQAVVTASNMLRHAAGNFYINDKPTGAVVGQQPFGGGRASGTNDKAGSLLNMIRWTSPRAIKENFIPPKYFKYPFMG